MNGYANGEVLPVPDSIIARKTRKLNSLQRFFKISKRDNQTDYTVDFFWRYMDRSNVQTEEPIKKFSFGQQTMTQHDKQKELLEQFVYALNHPTSTKVLLDREDDTWHRVRNTSSQASSVWSRTFEFWQADKLRDEITFIIGGVANDYICNLGILWELVRRKDHVIAPSYHDSYGSLLSKEALVWFLEDWKTLYFTKTAIYFKLILKDYLQKYPQIKKVNLVGFSTGCPVTLRLLASIMSDLTWSAEIGKVALLSPTSVIDRWKNFWPLGTLIKQGFKGRPIHPSLPQTNGYWKNKPPLAYRWRRLQANWPDYMNNMRPEPIYEKLEQIISLFPQAKVKIVVGGKDMITSSGNPKFVSYLREIAQKKQNFKVLFFSHYKHETPCTKAWQIFSLMNW